MPLARAFYRCRQVWQARWPRIDSRQLALAAAVLTPAQARLFGAMEPCDRRHALEVARRLREAGETDARLIAAALLHDCGKGAVPVWLRVVKVLAPGVLVRLSRPSGRRWQEAAFRLANHARLGAELARGARSDLLTVRLIAGEVAAAEGPMLQRLMAADDAS